MLRIFKLISPALPKIFHFLYPADRPDVHWRKLMSKLSKSCQSKKASRVQCDLISSLEKIGLSLDSSVNDLHWILLFRVVYDILSWVWTQWIHFLQILIWLFYQGRVLTTGLFFQRLANNRRDFFGPKFEFNGKFHEFSIKFFGFTKIFFDIDIENLGKS